MNSLTNNDYDFDTKIDSLGKQCIDSPLDKHLPHDDNIFISDDNSILIDVNYSNLKNRLKQKKEILAFEMAGPREKIFYDPSKVKCAIVTCGGLCPGLNDIIRAIVLELYFAYGVRNIIGIKYGFEGFIAKYKHGLVDLSPKIVESINALGGTMLGSSRERQDISTIVDTLERLNIGILFIVGGDGTMAAANEIAKEILERKIKISVIGIPKTIDNDIFMVSRSFGFDTAVELAAKAIQSAHAEAIGYFNGIGLIKLMGRHSGFIASAAALAQQDVNFVLIPEVDFDLDGKNGLFEKIKKRLLKRKHAVIVAAEGAGRKFFNENPNDLKKNDIGIFLKHKISDFFAKEKIRINMKYIDPSYLIRSVPANSNDHIFCSSLGRDAVHAGMAGKTRLIIGYRNDQFVHIPMEICVGKRKEVNPNSKLWIRVLESTGQGLLRSN